MLLYRSGIEEQLKRMFTMAALRNAIRNQASGLTIKRLSSTSVSAEASPVKLHAILTGPTGVGKTTIVQRVCSQLQEKHGDIELRGFSIEQVRQEYSWAGNRYLGPKIGFDVVTMDGRRGKLARIDIGGLRRFRLGKGTARKPKKNCFVNRYRVMTKSFERIALPELQIPTLAETQPKESDEPSKAEPSKAEPSNDESYKGEAVNTEKKKRPVYVIDEIEKMGLFSKPFVKGIRAILRQGPHLQMRKLRGMEPLVVLATLPKVSGEAHQLINEIKSREDCALFEVNEENRDSLVTEISDFLSQNLSKKTSDSKI